MASTRTAAMTIDAGQKDIRNMFNEENDQEMNQDSDQMDGHQARNRQNRQDCIKNLTLLSRKLKTTDVQQEKENKRKSVTRNGEINEETKKVGEKQMTFAEGDMMTGEDDDTTGDIEHNSQENNEGDKTNEVNSKNHENYDGMDENVEMWNKDEKKKLSIEMEFQPDIDIETCVGSIMHVTVELLTQWNKNNVIEGVHNKLGDIMQEDFKDLCKWAIEPKIVIKKKHITVETMLEVQSKSSAHAMHQNENEHCDSNEI